MKPWLLSLLTCLECGGELCSLDEVETEGDSVITGTLECGECDLLWPVLAGIPFLLADPGAYLSSHRDTILAALAEEQLASVATLGLIDDFSTGYVSDAFPIKDDWTEGEAGVVSELPESAELEPLRALVAQDQAAGPLATIAEMVSGLEPSVVFELGPGAGLLSKELAKHCERLLLIDNSLRSLLRARQTAGVEVACKISAVLADASQLELAADSASLVVAANVVDLLDKPDDFLSAASRWLVRGGELIMSTPDPSLGGDQDDMLKDMLEALDYDVVSVLDWVPWLRVHSSRYSQLYWTQVIRASV